MEEVQNPCVVSLTWSLNDAQGELIDTLDQPTEFLVGGEDLLPKVEAALMGQMVGAEIGVALEPADAFGEYEAELVCFEPRSLFPEQLEIGMRFEGLPEGAQTPDMPLDAVYTVTELYPEHVVLDGNHPLAGIGLRLHLQIRALREASAEELEAKSVGGSFVQVLEGTAPGDTPIH
ncbi:FKBP-type peptidyl-prolyl cis-trans isomerase SlyD [Inhella inkyongensis]|uniref:peptidylprolyl isomerase n=1 Tax=Inhella inkyongensis TaxID=392593 RepID=A0A840S175_9BURK|nr:peptidylprolyl isomerase [Inhella inkyongensis]MBB5204025.1 FKBP-type peptidyl-prolyl cis-trans isomerase SlyD [Inhella inkyongensis]